MHRDKADVIVVLGAAVRSDGMPGPALRRRVLHAVRLWREGRADSLLLTGGVGRYPPAEARVMFRLALELGVPPACLILEETATDTLQNAAASTAILQARGWSKAIVVTDAYHLPRARRAFRHYGLRAIGNAPVLDRRARCSLWRFYLREALAFPWYLLKLHVSGGR